MISGKRKSSSAPSGGVVSDTPSSDRLADLVKEANRRLTRAFQIRLSGHSVSIGHWAFLQVLWQRDGITQTELSTAAGLMLPTTHTALGAMERLGYIKRSRQAGDGRRVFVHLTAAGRRMREPLTALAAEVQAAALRDLAPADVDATCSVLKQLIVNLAADEDELLRAKRRMPSTRELAKAGRTSR